MKKLHHKLTLRISLLIVTVFAIIFLLNNLFLSDYYLHEKKIELSRAVEATKALGVDGLNPKIEAVEREFEVTVVVADDAGDMNILNGNLLRELAGRRVSLSKFWVTTEHHDKLLAGKTISQIYNQGKLKSSYLVSLYQDKSSKKIVLVGTAVVHDSDTLAIVNRFNLMIFSAALGVLLLMVWGFTNGITKPLEDLGKAAESLGTLNFTEVQIQTGDEVEALGERLNVMSRQLKTAYEALDKKNESLKRFTADISHELKTPIALIKAYSAGLRDGLDDGSFVETLERQADRLDHLVGELLTYAKTEIDALHPEALSLRPMIDEVLSEFALTLEEKEIQLSCQWPAGEILLLGDKEKLRRVLTNLIGNAVRYTADRRIDLSLTSEGRLEISNGCEWETEGAASEGLGFSEWDKIWEPFAVMPFSRDKDSSGTGLGLPIVAALLTQHGFLYGHRLEQTEAGGRIVFWVLFKVEPVGHKL